MTESATAVALNYTLMASGMSNVFFTATTVGVLDFPISHS